MSGLEGEIIPNVTMGFFWLHLVDFLLINEEYDVSTPPVLSDLDYYCVFGYRL